MLPKVIISDVNVTTNPARAMSPGWILRLRDMGYVRSLSQAFVVAYAILSPVDFIGGTGEALDPGTAGKDSTLL